MTSTLLSLDDSEVLEVIRSHAVVMAFYMREHAEASDLNDLLAEQVADLQEALPAPGSSTQEQIQLLQNAVRDHSKIESILTEKLEHAEGLVEKWRHEVSEAERKAMSSLEALNAESAAHRETTAKLVAAKQEVACLREALEKSKAEAEMFAAELNKAQAQDPAEVEDTPQPDADDVDKLTAENARLREVIRKVSTHVTRADENFADDPDKSLRALDYAMKLLAKAPGSKEGK